MLMPERMQGKGRDSHRIAVVLLDGTHHHVSPRVLNVMLDNNRVAQFKRSNGWVTVGAHPVRAKRRSDFSPLDYARERRISS